MGETAISPKVLEDALHKVLPSLLPNLLGTTRSARVEFYDKFQREADEYDQDFMKRYDGDLKTTLIFAGLFSAVTSAFIVDVQKKLEPDFQAMSYTLLKIIASSELGNIPTGPDATLPQWNGPDPTIVHVQASLYSSLAVSLIAAFGAMLGKQWLSLHGWVDMRGSVVDRSRHRERKMSGMATWYFDLVMECLPLMLQAALLLLGYALSHYLFIINEVVAGVVIGFAAFGLLSYFVITIAAIISHNCPFQTPFSLVIRFLIRYDNRHGRCIKRTRRWFRRIFKKKEQSRPKPDDPSDLRRFGTSDGNSFGDHFELSVVNPSDQPPPLFNKWTDWDGFVLDSNCIAWMFKMSMDMDVIMAIMRFIPEVVWHAGIRTTPLERLYDTVLKCFDHSSGHPTGVPKVKDEAYLSAKALLHLAIQRKCISHKSDKAAFKSISSRHKRMCSKRCDGDSDLTSTLDIIDYVFGKPEPICWKGFTFTPTHHTWMGHILLYRARDVLGKNEPLPDDIKEFILHAFQLEPPPPASVVADCLIIVGVILRIGFHGDDLSTVDKSSLIDYQTDRIYTELNWVFGHPTPNDICRALDVICLLSNHVPPSENYDLFHKVMQASITEANSEKKWEASRLTLHNVYKGDKFAPRVEDPENILTFLSHHFELAIAHCQNQDKPIQNALRALVTGSVTTGALEDFDPTAPSFIRGICHAFQGNRPDELRKVALLFLPLISDRWFNTYSLPTNSIQMDNFCKDWASAVDGNDLTDDVKTAALTALLGMINSSDWRPRIAREKWKLLEHFTLLPDDSQPLRRCLDNPELMDAIANLDNPVGITFWLEILWSKCTELPPAVREQLETVTKNIARNEGEADPDTCQPHIGRYLLNMNSALRRARDELRRYAASPTDPVAVALEKKVENLRQAVSALNAIKRENPPTGVKG